MGQHVLVLTYWSYTDALIQTYTLPYVKMISRNVGSDSQVTLVTFDREPITNIAELDQSGIKHLSFHYSNFGVRSVLTIFQTIFKLFRYTLKNRVTTIHAWGTTAGALGYFLSMLTGKSLVIDSYEPHAESMVENGTWKKNGTPFKILFQLEKLETKRAKYLIGTTSGMQEYAKKKYNYFGNNFFVKPACVNLNHFKSSPDDTMRMRKKLGIATTDIVCVYAGKFGGIYLNSEIFDFIKICVGYWKEGFKIILLTNEPARNIEDSRKKAGIPDGIITCLFVPHSSVNEYMSVADFALNPVVPVPSKKYCTSIKDGEYWAMGLPVVITKGISDDSDIIETNRIGSVIQELNETAYLKSIVELDALLKENTKAQLNEKIRLIAKKYRSYDIAENIYKAIYSGL